PEHDADRADRAADHPAVRGGRPDLETQDRHRRAAGARQGRGVAARPGVQPHAPQPREGHQPDRQGLMATNALPGGFDPALLKELEAALAQHLGPIARVVVKRAAVNARDEAELYLLLAAEIEDADDRKAFSGKK